MPKSKRKVKKKKWSSRYFEKERAEFFKKQDGKCAICRRPESDFKNRLALDHNHRTGQLRGLLCFQCNKYKVGRNDYASAEKLFNYLKVEKEKQC